MGRHLVESQTTIYKMIKFLHLISNDIGPATTDNFYVFSMDNLNSHKKNSCYSLTTQGVIYQVLYWVVDGSIEFVFNTIQTLLLWSCLRFIVERI